MMLFPLFIIIIQLEKKTLTTRKTTTGLTLRQGIYFMNDKVIYSENRDQMKNKRVTPCMFYALLLTLAAITKIDQGLNRVHVDYYTLLPYEQPALSTLLSERKNSPLTTFNVQWQILTSWFNSTSYETFQTFAPRISISINQLRVLGEMCAVPAILAALRSTVIMCMSVLFLFRPIFESFTKNFCRSRGYKLEIYQYRQQAAEMYRISHTYRPWQSTYYTSILAYNPLSFLFLYIVTNYNRQQQQQQKTSSPRERRDPNDEAHPSERHRPSPAKLYTNANIEWESASSAAHSISYYYYFEDVGVISSRH